VIIEHDTQLPAPNPPGLFPLILWKGEVLERWEELEPLIVRSCKHSQGSMSVEWVKKALLNGEAICMCTVENHEIVFATVTEIVNYPKYRVAVITAAAGSRAEESWHRFSHILEEWAFSMGALEIQAYTRPAMARLLRRLGFQPKFTIVSKDLRRRLQ
jgi:hypothetical protein